MSKRPSFLAGVRDRIADAHLPSSSRRRGRSRRSESSGHVASAWGCSYCGALVRMLSEEIWQEYRHGLREEIKFSADADCSVCSAIRQGFQRAHGDCAARFSEAEPFNLDSVSPMMGLDVYFMWPAAQRESSGRKGIYLLPLDTPGGRPPGRPVDPKVIDLRLVERWIQCCGGWHGEICRSVRYQGLDDIESLRVVDAQRRCLAYIPPSSRYFALSYVWGRAETLQTKKHNLRRLECEGALSSGDFKPPRTIRDALEVMSRIGERYIWIDALCIIQDEDSDEKPILLRQMDRIYGNAYVTIVAAVGDNADVGLPGIGGEIPRRVPQEVVTYGHGRRFAISQPPFENTLGQRGERATDTCVWNRRAWTLQERLLSQRKLVFLEEGVHFNCHGMTWTEDVAAENEETHRHFQMFDFEGVTDEDRWFSGISRRRGRPRKKDEYTLRGPDATFPSFVDYCNLVADHLQRDLSYEEDVLNAFQGVLGSLSRAFGAFHHGLPESFFTLALLWQPAGFGRRRVMAKDPGVRAKLPSWSWTGWTGEVDLQHWKAACDYLLHENTARAYRTTPAVAFSSPIPETQAQAPDRNSPDGRIPDDGLRYRAFADVPSAAWTERLPDGWHHDGVKEHAYLGRRRSGDFRIHTDPEVRFLYPVPAAPAADPLRLWERSLVLRFRAETASFRVSWMETAYSGRRNAASALDAGGRWCGVVILHERQPEWGPQGQAREEFVKIADGEIFAGCVEEDVFPEARLVRCWGAPEWYRYVNVIMVRGTEGGMMERVGVGRIREDGWRSAARKAKDVCLT